MALAASPDARASYRQYDLRRQQFRAMLLDARDRLDALYHSPLSDDAKRAGKAEIFAGLRARYAKLKEEWGGYSGYDRWFERPLTNAQLAAVATYQQWVPAFTVLLAQNGGDWTAFYAEVRRIGDLPRAERDARLRQLAPPASGADALTAGESGTAVGAAIGAARASGAPDTPSAPAAGAKP